MLIEVLKCKIHRAVVTAHSVDYEGSITIDESLIRAAGLIEHEKVHVFDINNGERFVTYVIKAPAGSGVICVNGAAAKLVETGDLVIIAAFASAEPAEAAKIKAKIILVDSSNRPVKAGGK